MIGRPDLLGEAQTGINHDAFGRDRANLEAATPPLWKPYPSAWLSKVHDEAVAIVRTDEYRMLWWEEFQKVKAA